MLLGTPQGCGIWERLSSRWLAVIKVGSSPPNVEPRITSGSVEGEVDFRLLSSLPKNILQELAGGIVRWRVWPTN